MSDEPNDEPSDEPNESAEVVSAELSTYSTVNSLKAGKILDVDIARKHLTVLKADGSHEIIDAQEAFAYGNPQIGDYFVVANSETEFYIGGKLFEALFFPPAAPVTAVSEVVPQ